MRIFKFGLLALMATIAGCSGGSVDVIDLNKVLDVFQATLTQLDGDDKDSVEGGEKLAAVEEEKADKQKEFLTKFATNLNAKKLIKSPIGVSMEQSGAFEGFADKNKNNKKDAGEKQVFKLEIDPERQRVVASDYAGHYRDHAYRPRFGFFSGYIFGSMMHRNRGYYSGSRSAMKPNYGSKKMSPKTYHKSAVSKAKTAARKSRSASRARSRSGSRGSSFGK